MPVNNRIAGLYDIVFIGATPVIAAKANRNRTMATDGEVLIQGTPKQRILNIGGVKEEFDIEGPILLGGGQAVDTRNLMGVYLKRVLTPQTTPDNVVDAVLLTSANLTVGTNGADINLKFKSDGNPNNKSFRTFGGLNGKEAADSLPTSPTDPLNPYTQKPSRKAIFSDFRVNLGGYKYFIISLNLSVTIEVEEKYFISGADTLAPGDPQTPGGGENATPKWDPTNNPNNWGTQFPWLFIKGIKLNGGGSAAVKKVSQDSGGFWDTAVNVGFKPSDYELTLQAPGEVNISGDTFGIQVFEIDYVGNPNATAGTGQWRNLFKDPTVPGHDLMDLSKSVITGANFSETPGLLTVAFTFVCWVV